MNERDFVYWLVGYLKCSQLEGLTKEQLEVVKKHLKFVFVYPEDPTPGGLSNDRRREK